MSTTFLSGINDIDALLFGTQWDGAVTYQFGQPLDGYPPGDYDPASQVPLSAVEKTALRDIFGQLSQLTGLSLTETTLVDPRDIYISKAPAGSPGTFASGYPLSFYIQPYAGDFTVYADGPTSPASGSHDRLVFQRAVGSVVGLKIATEPQNWGYTADVDPNPAVLDDAKASFEFTSMLWNDAPSGNYPQSWMMLDIQALQYMYGADFGTRSGDTYYQVSPTTGELIVDGVGQGVPKLDDGVTNSGVTFRTIWDGGGIDTYSFFGATHPMSIDLRPGHWIDLDTSGNFRAALLDPVAGTYARGQLYNALLFNGDTRSLIENATGGTLDDVIIGNAADNHLLGMQGDDVLEGLAGADRLDGERGNDTASYAESPSAVQVVLDGKVTGGDATGDTLLSIESLRGSAWGDLLVGNGLANRLEGGAGDDVLSGQGGADSLYGQDGDDSLQGGDGPDLLDGGPGFDTAGFLNAVTVRLNTGVHGGEAAGDVFVAIERFSGSSFDDEFVGATAPVVFVGNAGNDRLVGGDGNDLLQGGPGQDVIDGGAGLDIVSYADSEVAVGVNLAYLTDTGSQGKVQAGDWGPDQLTSIEGVEGSLFDDLLIGTAGDNVLRSLGGNDTLVGSGGADTLLAGEGDDLVMPGTGRDTADGGNGIDTVSYEDQRNGVTVHLGLSTPQQTGAAGTDTLTGFENLYGGQGNDTLKGTNGPNVMDGMDGNDLLEGLSGDDVLRGGLGNDNLRPWVGNDIVDGGDGIDNVGYVGLGLKITVDLAITTPQNTGAGLHTITNVENVAGGANADTVRGTDGPNVMLGNQGNDILEGREGNDQLFGGIGDDTLRPGTGGDIVDGGDGVDLISFLGITSPVTLDLALTTPQFIAVVGTKIVTNVESASGGNGNDTLRGTDGANVLFGNLGNDLLEGRGGDDILNGQAGDDNLRPGPGVDVVNGGDGIDNVGYVDIASGVAIDLAAGRAYDTAGPAFDSLVNIENAAGGAGNDTIVGSAGVNVLIGNNGDDFLLGGGGNDLLHGGPGADLFVYRSLGDASNLGPLETITGFVSGVDHFDFRDLDWSPAPGLQTLTFVQGPFTAAGQMRFANQQLLVNADADLNTSEMIIAMPGVLSLTAADFAPIPALVATSPGPIGAAMASGLLTQQHLAGGSSAEVTLLDGWLM